MDVFLTEDDNLLEKYNTIWDKVSADSEFDSEPVHNKKFLKSKILPYDNEATGIRDK